MRLTASEKEEIILDVVRSELGVNRTLKMLGLNKSTFYQWYKAYSDHGIDGLVPSRRASSRQWNAIPQEQKNLVRELALEHPKLSSRELSCMLTDEQQIFISESSVYRILKQAGLISPPAHMFMQADDEFKTKTRFVHQMWQTDFTYFKIIGRGWYYLSTILDDYSRYIVHWELCSSMKAEDVKRAVDRAIEKAQIKTQQSPKLLSDNGSCYISGELKEYLKKKHEMDQIHGRPLHPQTQGKIERYHLTMKNIVKLDNYFSPDELEAALQKFVDYYNTNRYHESLNNLTPEDVYYGRGDLILKERERIKTETLTQRRNEYQKNKLQKTTLLNTNFVNLNLTKHSLRKSSH